MYLCTEVVQSWITLVASDREQVQIGNVSEHQSTVSNEGRTCHSGGGPGTQIQQVSISTGTVEDVGVQFITSSCRSLREVHCNCYQIDY